MGIHKLRRALAGACLLVLVGCSSPAPGFPVAAETSVTSEVSTSSPAPSTGAPSTTRPSVQRPAPINLSQVDICQVVAALPRRKFGLDDDRPPLGGRSLLFPGSLDCSASGIDTNASMLAVAVTNRDAPSYVDSANVTAKTDGVAAGYPMTVLTPRNPDTCIAVVDVHDGQMLYVSYGTPKSGTRPVQPQPQLCGTVAEIATAAVGLMR
ncbi:DUF3558 domain-containing protein [Actinophytocola xanthii]|uniref:DUF3558 domain-containing protein n=1 Tax=Actinophytocola xanthii TaxID=1912961 RepID=A0A1Q8CFX9_9PSEU|nr:DUF3558 domain-containing protein [Actinophytocola xanthii]OLF05003.1 hypothetical protein BU204_37435 [Actinophytocola xanthii]OLF13233.1 hypothetical protein BU204_28020 [Actinophytocola xanthii]